VAAALAIPPRAARTSSPYRIGIRVDFHLPASITDARSIFNASRCGEKILVKGCHACRNFDY
jgi:hypothetical protein